MQYDGLYNVIYKSLELLGGLIFKSFSVNHK